MCIPDPPPPTFRTLPPFVDVALEVSNESSASSWSSQLESMVSRARPARCCALRPLMSVSVAKLPTPSGSADRRTTDGNIT